MKRFEVFSGYRQFYVADVGLAPEAPMDWTDVHTAQRHNALRHIVALCPEGDISARVVCCGPDDTYPEFPHLAEFEVKTAIEVQSGRIGVYGWPDELMDEYSVPPGTYSVWFRGYALDQVESENDYYGVEIRLA